MAAESPTARSATSGRSDALNAPLATPGVLPARLAHKNKVDLVLAGGGVKGIAHVGALKALHDHGYTDHPRVAGTSVGAIIGGLLSKGSPPCEIWDTLADYDFSQVADAYDSLLPGPARRLAGSAAARLGIPNGFAGLLGLRTHLGAHPGKAATEWLSSVFAADGPQTFGELREAHGRTVDDPPPLVIMATDITLGRLVQFPRDFNLLYGLDGDRQSIFEAVRASMSIPLYFEPYKIQAAKNSGLKSSGGGPRRAQLGRSRFVDGGVLANFAVDVLDRQDPVTGVAMEPRWPTFGVTLLRNESPVEVGRDLRNGVADFAKLDDHLLGRDLSRFTDALIGTLVVGQDENASQHWWMARRTIRIETKPYGIVQFSIGRTAKERLFQQGYEATADFLRDQWRVEPEVGFDGRAYFPLPAPASDPKPCRG